VDNFSDYTYVHLMTTMDGASTVEAKLAFERVASSNSVTVKHYHADNGLYDTKIFKKLVSEAGQTLSFCGVNAHHQNSKVENRIKDITTGGRTPLLHAAHRWPKAIHAALWPSALKNYTNLRNALPTEFTPGPKQGRKKLPGTYIKSPASRFAGMEVETNLNHFRPFGTPVYVLESKLQAQQSHNKWSDRARVGFYLCHSPSHSTSVPLILNTQSGNVSPQFHCIYDEEFATCKRDAKFNSLWQYKAKLQSKTFSVDHVDALPTADKLTKPIVLPDAADPLPRFVEPWDSSPELEPTGLDNHPDKHDDAAN
jgi:hypothetical protein